MIEYASWWSTGKQSSTPRPTLATVVPCCDWDIQCAAWKHAQIGSCILHRNDLGTVSRKRMERVSTSAFCGTHSIGNNNNDWMILQIPHVRSRMRGQDLCYWNLRRVTMYVHRGGGGWIVKLTRSAQPEKVGIKQSHIWKNILGQSIVARFFKYGVWSNGIRSSLECHLRVSSFQWHLTVSKIVRCHLLAHHPVAFGYPCLCH